MNYKYVKPVLNKIKIPIEYKWGPLFLLFFFIIGSVILYYMLAHDLGQKNATIIISLYSVFLIYVAYGAFTEDEKAYVSDLEITNGDLAIIYKKKNKTIKTKVIPLADIKSFNVELELTVYYSGRSIKLPSTNAKTQIIIKTTQERISFSSNTNYQSVLRLFRNSCYIPNFSYELKGNYINELPYLKNEIEHNMVYRKKMTLSQSLPYILQYNVKMFPFIILIITFVLYGIYIFLRKYGII